MPGLIGQALMNVGSTIGGYMMQGIRDDEVRADRLEMQRERERERAELQRERLAATERENQRNRELRAELAPNRGGGGSGGLSMKDIGEGGSAEGLIARQAGMTVPGLRALRRSSETGDLDLFKRDVTRYSRDQDDGMAGANDEYSDAVSRKYSTLKEEKLRELPPGFEQEYRAKLKTLAKIEESYLLGKDYEQVAKGRQTQQEVDASERAMENPAMAGRIGQGIAAGQGKDLIDGDSNVTRNKFTGATSTTDVGKSVVSENQAQANKYNKEAETGSRAEKNKEFQGLQQERLAIDADLKRAEDAIKSLRKDTPKGWDAEVKTLQEKISRLEEDKKSVQERIRTFTQSEAERGRGSPRSGAPAPAGGGTQARRGVFNPSTGQIEWK